MQVSLVGRTALVTGASRGIGRYIAQRLASAGATVAVAARSLDAPAVTTRPGAAPEHLPGTLAETVKLIEAAGGRAAAVAADLEDAESRATLVARAALAMGGGIDILVNNGGFAQTSPFYELPEEVFDQTVAHYLKTPFVLARAALPHMRRQGAGWIVNIGSAAALPPTPPFRSVQWTVYGAVKAGLARLTQGMAAELIEENIAVNLVAPSTAVMTPGGAPYLKDFPVEDPAYIAETVLAMCHLPARERTGMVTYSMHFPAYHALEVHGLDGRTEMPPAVIPALSHPAISASGR